MGITKMKKTINGISLIEIMIAVLVIGVAFFGFMKLLSSSLKSTSYANQQKQINLAGQYILDRINANLEGGTDPNYYAQGNAWLNNNPTPATLCNAGTTCTQVQQRAFDLFQWQQYLATLRISGLRGIVCLDNAAPPGVPTLNSPNCTNSGTRLYIKLFWQNNLAANESGNVRNSLIIPVLATTNLTLSAVDNSVAGGGGVTPPANPGQFVFEQMHFGPSFTQCYGSDCSNTVVMGACNGSDCSGSVFFGNCNGSTSCANTTLLGACNSSADCSGSLMMGDCNSSNCSNSFIGGSCNQGDCSGSVILGNCWGSNCRNSLIYGACNGDCTGSVVFGGDSIVNAVQSGGGSSCWGTGCPGVATNALYPSISYNSSTGVVSGIEQSMFGALTYTSMDTSSCQNGGTCNSSVINGACGNGGSCTNSLINGSCNNNSTCSGSVINGSCANNGVCTNSIIIGGTCGNNANCTGSTIVGNCANNGSCCANNANCTNVTCRKTDGSVGTCR